LPKYKIDEFSYKKANKNLKQIIDNNYIRQKNYYVFKIILKRFIASPANSIRRGGTFIFVSVLSGLINSKRGVKMIVNFSAKLPLFFYSKKGLL